MSATLELVSSQRCFGGWQRRFRHASASTRCEMTFSVYLPPQAQDGARVPALYWLSGLTCTDENFSTKAGAQRAAAELGLALVIPDTSPRGAHVADAERYDLGQGAGFYLNATQAPWSEHYRMEDYIVDELPALLEAELPIGPLRAISGHSMGGHGALTLAMRHPGRYVSASAFAPIVNPADTPWGQQAFAAYLGEAREAWLAHDASQLMATVAHRLPLRVDQGGGDSFLPEQLQPEVLCAAAKAHGWALDYTLHPDYDHSYYFIASLIEAHLRFHAGHLAKA